ncbi:fatty acid synthase-like [Anoplophora glabripennis]|uniref:fatty acid synthase-like n=1 Tax=Anoplophora glabripennis TaxID=217634 RepID=UPI000C7758F2|nr:fatty acid synthase-like [Anoplophora glabripennis]
MEITQNLEDDVKKKEGPNYNFQGGKAMASVKAGEEIVISGMSGAFPNSNNIHEFRDNLYNKVNMVLPNRRWDLIHPEIPPCSGTIPDIEQYDRGFFGVHERQSDSLDPVISLVQEKTIEAILDAGLNPLDLENTRTGVFMGACYCENDKMCYFVNLIPNSYTMTGAQRSMIAHRLSYFLKLKGPSYVTDTACSSSLYAFEHAYQALRRGEIDNAIVGGVNLCLHPLQTLQFARLGVLSKDGTCKSFDEEGNGYVRSEAVAVLFLQRTKNAKRIYAEVVYAKTNCDGYKEQGITFPSKERQGELLTEFYDECGVDRYSLSFLEAHGTGTTVGDPEECSAIDDVLAKRRTEPLLIGSVKSNIGHSEPTSGVCSIIKVNN